MFNESLLGIVYFSMSASQIPLYVLVMMAVRVKDREEPSISYKLINLIHFWQIGQTVGHFVTSPILVFPELQTSLSVPVRVIGSTMSLFYCAELPTVALLAVCRILIFSQLMRPDRLHSGAKCLLFGAFGVLFAIYLYTCISGLFVFRSPAWTFDVDVRFSILIANVFFVTSILSLATAYVSYLVIVYMIYVRKQDAVSLKSRKNEISIMVQYTMIVVYTTVTLTFWHKAGIWFDMESNEMLAAVNISWIAGAYMNPALILIFNRSVREESAKILGWSAKREPILFTSGSSIFDYRKSIQ